MSARFVLRAPVAAALTLTAAVAALPPTAAVGQADAERASLPAVLTGYAAAHGGADRWRAVDTLVLRGTYATFSQKQPFTLLRKRPDRYRLDFVVLGEPSTVARDAEGPWWRFPLLEANEPSRVTFEPYIPQIERTARFAPLLLEPDDVEITLLGPDEIDGTPTLALMLSFADGSQETWHLDPATYLEVAIDSTVYDFTQAAEPMARRTYFGDFREVDGLVLPHRVEHEFGARLEVMEVGSVEVGTPLPEARFALPK